MTSPPPWLRRGHRLGCNFSDAREPRSLQQAAPGPERRAGSTVRRRDPASRPGASGPAPSCPRPRQRDGLTITTRESLCTDGSPQPPPQQLSSKGAAILPGPTFGIPEVLLPPTFRQVGSRGRGEKERRDL